MFKLHNQLVTLLLSRKKLIRSKTELIHCNFDLKANTDSAVCKLSKEILFRCKK